jgi:uncharacterized damage-inducible protein DinB
VHALELSLENIEQHCASLSAEQMNARPGGVAPIAFHLRHIVRSLDRLLTYAEGNQLSPEQMTALKSELDPVAAPDEAFGEFNRGMQDAILRIHRLAKSDLEGPRSVGRKALPTTVGGLLVHCADHTQRHTGQAVTTAKILQAGSS